MSDNESRDVPRVALGLLLSQEENRQFLVECRKNPERNQSSNLEEAGQCDAAKEEKFDGIWTFRRVGVAAGVDG